MNDFSLDYFFSFVVHVPDNQLNAFLPRIWAQNALHNFYDGHFAIAFFFFVHHTPNENQFARDLTEFWSS